MVNKELVSRRRSIKKMFFEISQNLQKNTCARFSFLIKLLKNRLCQRCFPVNLKFPRTTFLMEHLWWLLLLCTKTLSNYFKTPKSKNHLFSLIGCYNPIVYKKTSGRYIEWQRVKNEWQRVVQQKTTSDNESQRVAISANS